MKGKSQILPLDRLAALVEKLKPQQVARLPLLKLPDDLPEEWIAQFPADKAAALSELRRRLREPHAKARETERVRRRLRTALQWLRRPDTLCDWIDEYESALEETERAFMAWREHNERFTSTGSWRASEALESEITMDSRAGMEFSTLAMECENLVRQLNEQQPTIAKYTGLMKVLQKQNAGLISPTMVAQTLTKAHDTLNRLQDMVSRLRILQLYVIHNEMLAVRERIENEVDRRLRLDSNVRRLDLDIRKSDSWLGRLRGGPSAEKLTSLKELRDSLQLQRARMWIPVPDASLIRWINVLVEVSVDTRCRSLARSRVDSARTLLVGLLKYRRRAQTTTQSSAKAGIQGAVSTGAEQADVTPQESLKQAVTQELQQFMRENFEAMRPDALYEFRAQQGMFHARLQQLQNQLISEFLATTSPRHLINA